MTRAFIIRPFGIKKDSAGKQLDFDRVEKELIMKKLLESDAATGTVSLPPEPTSGGDRR